MCSSSKQAPEEAPGAPGAPGAPKEAPEAPARSMSDTELSELSALSVTETKLFLPLSGGPSHPAGGRGHILVSTEPHWPVISHIYLFLVSEYQILEIRSLY